MAAEQEFTQHYGLPLPHPDRDLDEDVFVLRDAISGVDEAINNVERLANELDGDVQGVGRSVQELAEAVPTKTGAGATGVWDIDITGEAGSLEFANLKNVPTTLQGHGITDAVAAADFTFAKLGSKPTTVDGYGITDAVKLSGGTMTGILGSVGINLGSSVAATANNVTRHLNLYGGSFGLSITSSRLNYVSNAAHVFMTGATDTVTISNAGTITAIGNLTANSDERLKGDWEELPPDFLKRLSGLKAGTYRRRDLNERHAGVSAQGLQAILPEAVMVADDEQGTLSVAYGNAAMVACVVLAQKVTELEHRIEALGSSCGGK